MTSDPRALDGRALARTMQETTAQEVAELKESGWTPRLVSITVGNVDAVAVYVRNQRRQAEKVGIEFIEQHFKEGVSHAELEMAVRALNLDPRVTGIILQRPVPEHIGIRAIQSAIHPLKDVEGMNPQSIGNIVYNDLDMAPCTAAASVELLKATGMELEGLEVVVVGHSEIVGKPIAFLLMAEGATVTVCHHMTRSVAAHARRADALFVAVGKPELVGADWVKPGAAVIDIGINAVKAEDGTDRIVGDVDWDGVKDVASWVTPVPGGVGPVTVAILMKNTLTALKMQRAHYGDKFDVS